MPAGPRVAIIALIYRLIVRSKVARRGCSENFLMIPGLCCSSFPQRQLRGQKVFSHNVYTLADNVAEYWGRDPNTAVVINVLQQLNHPYEINDKLRISLANIRGKKTWFQRCDSQLNSRFAARACINKIVTKSFLRSAGASTPRGDVFAGQQLEEALRYAHFLGFPVVVKPLDGIHGKGVNAGINSEDGFRSAWEAQAKGAKIIVEKHVEGDDFRAFVLDGEVLAVARRDPPAVIADGKSTIAELISQLNERRRASGNPIHRQIRINDVIKRHLHQQGLSSESVCPAGSVIRLRSTANISTGGTAVDVTESPPPAVVEEAIKAARSVPGLRVVGVDVLYSEGRPPSVLEMNHNPMLSLHHFPWTGKSRNVARAYIEALLAP